MGKKIHLIFLFLLLSCGRNEVEEHHVCETQGDCRVGYECKFDLNSEKTYGSCVELTSCESDSDCIGRVCNQEQSVCVTNGVLQIKSYELPNAEKNTQYETTLEFSGVVENYFYFEAETELPEGLSLSETGIISGVPTKDGEFEFKVKLYTYPKNGETYYNRASIEKTLHLLITFNPCENNPCVDSNRTICIQDESEMGYHCDCEDGFILYNDSCVDPPCEPNPCTENNKSICTTSEDYQTFECSCNEGYYLSESGECKFDYCAENPCSEANRSICTLNETVESGYTCSCDEGYLDSNGSCVYNYCVPNPCTESNKNICTLDSSESGYSCACNNGFALINGVCIRDLCSPNPCVLQPHKTVCSLNETGTAYSCGCEAGYKLGTDGTCVVQGDVCSDAVTIEANTPIVGDTSLMTQNYLSASSTCGRNAASKDMVYTFTIDSPKLATVLMEATDENFNCVVYIQSTCGQSGSEIACNAFYEMNSKAKIDNQYLEAGTYFIIADGYQTSVGEFTMTLSLNEPCDENNPCEEPLVCNPETRVCVENLCFPEEGEIDCGENGVCEPFSGLCNCNDGFINNTTDNICVEDQCFNNPCQAGQTCIRDDFEGNYHCECPEGELMLENGSCAQNPCSENPCQDENRSICEFEVTENSINYQCLCDDGFLLDTNTDSCIDPCEDNPCIESGKNICSVENSVVVCSCNTGYTLQPDGRCLMGESDTCPGTPILVGDIVTGSTTGKAHNYVGTCATSSTSPDVVYQFTLTKKYKITATLTPSGWDSVLYIRKTSCSSTEASNSVGCHDTVSTPEKITQVLNAGTYFIFVDGYGSSNSGNYTLSLQGEPACTTGADCTGDFESCNTTTSTCVCADGYSRGTDEACHETCSDGICDSLLDECISGLCYRKTECEPACGVNSSCNQNTLECECNEGFFNNNDVCIADMCYNITLDCGDFASCQSSTGECGCNSGYINYQEGVGCVDDLNPCTPENPCTEANKNSCTPQNETDFICECNTGFIDTPEGCIDNPCEPNPCGSNSICYLENYIAMCGCQEGYYKYNGVCTAIPGDSCGNPIDITTGTVQGEITTQHTDRFQSICSSLGDKEQIYRLSLENSGLIRVTTSTTLENSSISIAENCGTTLYCDSSSLEEHLDAGVYYLTFDSPTVGVYSIDVDIILDLDVQNRVTTAVSGVNYKERLPIIGGVSPYSVILTGLPTGLSLVNEDNDWYIEGITTEVGSFSIDVTVTDSLGETVNRTLDFNVRASETSTPEIGDLVINEIMHTPTNDWSADGYTHSSNDEYVEIVNVSYKTLDLSNITLSDSLGVRHSFSGTLQPKNSIVIFGGGTINLTATNVRFETASSGRLSLNGTDSITLKNGDTIYQEISFDDSVTGVSLNRSPDITGTVFIHHNELVPNIKGTPGTKADGTQF
ncbi:lamin tail domain-containing protein [bacterium]|nr:lamin tail domain-containing protein [bacterium]